MSDKLTIDEGFREKLAEMVGDLPGGRSKQGRRGDPASEWVRVAADRLFEAGEIFSHAVLSALVERRIGKSLVRIFAEDPEDDDIRRLVKPGPRPLIGLQLSTAALSEMPPEVAELLEIDQGIVTIALIGRGASLGRAIGACRALGQVTHLHLNDRRVANAGLKAISESEHLRRLVDLDLSNNQIGPSGAKALAASTILETVARLDLSGNVLGTEGVRAIVGSPRLANLNALRLRGCGLTDEQIVGCAEAIRLSALSWLDLRAGEDDRLNRIGSEGARSLAACSRLAGLTHLDLSENPIGQAGLLELLTSDPLAGVTHLFASDPDAHGGEEDDESEELTEHDRRRCQPGPKRTSKRVRISLGETWIDREVGRTLFRETEYPHLTHLDLTFAQFEDDADLADLSAPQLIDLRLASLTFDLEVLVPATFWPTVRYLDLSRAGLGPSTPPDALLARLTESLETLILKNPSEEAAIRLAKATHVTGLKHLFLTGWRNIGPGGAIALAKAEHLSELITLDLSNNPIGDSGAHALAQAGHLRHLTELDLSYCRINDEGASALAVAEHLGGLRRLNLRDFRPDSGILGGFGVIGPDSAHALADSPHLGALQHLDLGDHPIGEDALIALIDSPNLNALRGLRIAKDLVAIGRDHLKRKYPRRKLEIQAS